MIKSELLRMEQVSLPGYLDGFRLNIYQGEVLVLASLSGSQSEVIADILDGSVTPRDGLFWLDERPLKPREAATSYKAQLFRFREKSSLIPGMSIAENIFNIQTRHSKKNILVHPKENAQMTQIILNELGLSLHPDEPVGRLSAFAMHKIEIVKAVALGARLVIIEDVWGGFPDVHRSALFDLMKKLCDLGVAFLILTQRHEDFASVMDRIVIFHNGCNFRTLPGCEYRAGFVDRLLIGEHYIPTYESAPPDPAEPLPTREVLRISGLSCRHLKDLNLAVHVGEIVCVLDMQDRGQEELIRVLTEGGTYSGSIELNGVPFSPGERSGSPVNGVGAVSFQGGNTLFENLTWPENLALMSRRQLSDKTPLLGKGVLRYLQSEYRDELDGLAADRPLALSGATVYQRRKLTLLKWIISGPKLLLCSKPCSEGDVLLREITRSMLRKAADSGIAVLIASSNPMEALACADSIAVLSDGRIKAILEPAEFLANNPDVQRSIESVDDGIENQY